MHHNYGEKATASEFVAVLIDAILDDMALEETANPIYELSNQRERPIIAADCLFHRRKLQLLLRELTKQDFRILWIHIPLMLLTI